MDSPFNPQHLDHIPCRRGRTVPAWIPIAIIAGVLGLTAFAASQVTDTRDFAARHGTVLKRTAL
jgi:hypothetical protein